MREVVAEPQEFLTAPKQKPHTFMSKTDSQHVQLSQGFLQAEQTTPTKASVPTDHGGDGANGKTSK